MAALFAYGIIFAVSLIIGILLFIAGLFLGHIILFDSIFLAILTGVFSCQFGGLHPAVSLIMGIGFLLMIKLHLNARNK